MATTPFRDRMSTTRNSASSHASRLCLNLHWHRCGFPQASELMARRRSSRSAFASHRPALAPSKNLLPLPGHPGLSLRRALPLARTALICAETHSRSGSAAASRTTIASVCMKPPCRVTGCGPSGLSNSPVILESEVLCASLRILAKSWGEQRQHSIQTGRPTPCMRASKEMRFKKARN